MLEVKEIKNQLS
uniref:Uncharacterized protein n=1 Tax=Arundo donax TaxID=35708 RepID=A0A0A9G269_ARUDO